MSVIHLRQELVDLKEFLQSDAVPDGGMQLSELDGYLTGLAAGPEPIPIEEWFAAIWDYELPKFTDYAQAKKIMATIMLRYNEILQTLDAGSSKIQPIYRASGNNLLADEWANGFIAAMHLRRKAWEPIFAHPANWKLLLPILLLSNHEDGEPFFPIDRLPQDLLLKEIPNLIPGAVEEIYWFWSDQKLTPQPIRAVPKIGRNDPCPCGSGKKFKRCCLAA